MSDEEDVPWFHEGTLGTECRRLAPLPPHWSTLRTRRTSEKGLAKGIKTADFTREGQCGAEDFGSADQSGGDRSRAAAGRSG